MARKQREAMVLERLERWWRRSDVDAASQGRITRS